MPTIGGVAAPCGHVTASPHRMWRPRTRGSAPAPGVVAPGLGLTAFVVRRPRLPLVSPAVCCACARDRGVMPLVNPKFGGRGAAPTGRSPPRGHLALGGVLKFRFVVPLRTP